MKLEDEIKQKAFIDMHEKAVLNIIVTANRINEVVSKFMKSHGITPQQYNVLRILKGQYPNPATVNLISGRMLDKMSNASRIVDKLFAKKLVERKTCSEDRRAVDIVLSKKGMEFLDKLTQSLYKIYDDNFRTLNEEETRQLNNLLDKFRN
jgi:DNA-binding MarR family transcriptional regulator